ncbi:MAG: hypothetical protein GY847_12630, partial [Proteobacteria bacterium]|nr:hypothetical protein [Pseudomonadota bacterium]
MNDIGISAIISLLAAASAVAGFMWLWPDTLPASPMAGERGRRRKEALDMGGFFHFVEPLIRVLALHVASLPLNGMRSRIEKRLTQAGRPLGLDANDLISASILTAATIGLVGGIASAQLGRGAGAGIITGLVFGAITPWFKVDDVSRKRCIAVCRGLPQAIDLVALSMEAGLDFPGALSQVTGQLPANNPLRFEFEHILQKLSLGWSRRTALDELSVRIQAPQVRQFTSSVNQA